MKTNLIKLKMRMIEKIKKKIVIKYLLNVNKNRVFNKKVEKGGTEASTIMSMHKTILILYVE